MMSDIPVKSGDLGMVLEARDGAIRRKSAPVWKGRGLR